MQGRRRKGEEREKRKGNDSGENKTFTSLLVDRTIGSRHCQPSGRLPLSIRQHPLDANDVWGGWPSVQGTHLLLDNRGEGGGRSNEEGSEKGLHFGGKVRLKQKESVGDFVISWGGDGFSSKTRSSSEC